ncbi:MAG TPA: hypothetical protein VN363_00125 [Anaerolineales bacterium]|nr:hypothetical protein [Anaerolineales bacterium]
MAKLFRHENLLIRFLPVGILRGRNCDRASAQRQQGEHAAQLSWPACVFDVGGTAGILITGMIMLKGIFGMGTAYLGLLTVTGAIAIFLAASSFFSSSLSSISIILASFLTTVWVLLVGFGLYRLGRR